MLIIYDEQGKIITEQTEKHKIIGQLKAMEVPDNKDKIVQAVDVSGEIHKPIYVDAPPIKLEKLQEQFLKVTQLLTYKDNQHDESIKGIKVELEKINLFIRQNFKESEVK
ncbi:hypothetical protein [Clostridium ihumii]|uniref:hypothetical protein n=1 Tax=Clostridium ihumii TaxID=1470356 RepID=UPI0005541956|nr:hypothetical protein [Clostridium ihumii]